MKTVGIVGYGYVGKGMHRLFGRAHKIRIYDPAFPGHSDREALNDVDLAVICVPTPPFLDGSCDTSDVLVTAGWLKSDLVLIKSTVPPGTTVRLNSLYPSDRFHFSPEFMGEPRNFVPPWKYPDPQDPGWHDFAIVGGPQAGRVLDFFVPCMGSHTRFVPTDATSAELAKYMENSYFAMKVSFVTEFARLAKLFGVDWHTLRYLWQLDPRVDPDHTAVFPDNPGWGGKCLPKDVSAILEAARAKGYTSRLLEQLIAINRDHRGERL